MDWGSIIETKFCIFVPLVKIRGGIVEKSEPRFQGQPRTQSLYTCSAAAVGFGRFNIFSLPIFLGAILYRLILRVGGAI